MVTDDERREVARRLRKLADICEDEDFFDTEDFGKRVANLFPEFETERAVYANLADLIEPSEPKTKCVAEVKIDGEQLEKLANEAVAKVTGIDRDTLLALADELEQEPGPVCGVCMGKTARRIREALGVVK